MLGPLPLFISLRSLRGEWGGKCFRQKSTSAKSLWSSASSSRQRGATQWTAAALGFQERLDSPWFLIANYPVYLPWRLFEWWFAYEAYAPQIFEKAGAIAAAGGMAGALFAIINSVWRARQSQLVTTYGSARWASSKEIKAAGLFAARGVFLGRLENSYLRHDGPEHVMCFAPTRSGKGVGLVLPTLLSWTSSAVVRRHRGFRGVDRRPVQPSYQGILSGRIHPCHAVPSGMAVQRIRLVVTVCGRFPPKKGDQVGGKDQTKSMLSPVQLSLGVALGPSNRRHCSYSGLHAGAD
jgi:Type IV secretory system Conjugative DNA transfer